MKKGLLIAAVLLLVIGAAAGSLAQKLVDHLPVYRLQATDTKTSAAKLLLKDFAVQNGEIHISPGL